MRKLRAGLDKPQGLLGGSWVVISRVISRVAILITHIRGLTTLLITTPESPSRVEETHDLLGIRTSSVEFRVGAFRV